MDSKKMAQKAAKSLAQEPMEVLKTAGEQITGVNPEAVPDNPLPEQDDQKKALNREREAQDKEKSDRRISALDRELGDIHKQEVFNSLQQRIAQGEEIPLADFTELSMDQKQVLKAQMEAVKTQNAAGGQGEETLIEPSAKPGRRFGITRKQEVQRQQTRIEKPVPPSG